MLVSRRLRRRISDSCNAISIGRFSSKTKIGKDSWYFHNSLLCKPDFPSAAKDLLSSEKSQKNKNSSLSDWWEYTKSRLEKNAGTFFKNSTKQEKVKISRPKQRLKNLYKKENFEPESKPMIQTLLDEPYQLESEHPKTYFNVLETQYAK